MTIDRRTTLGLMAAAAAAPAVGFAQGAAPNPLTAVWTGPYGGVPAFDKVKVSDFEPAFDDAMTMQRKEIDAITRVKSMPTFDNTIVALEKSGQAVERVYTYYGIWSGNLSSPEVQAASKVISPKLAAFSDEISQNEALFQRVESVYQNQDKMNLTPEQKRLLWVTYIGFVRSGAKLSAASKTRIAEINKELAGLFTQFSDNLLHDEEQVTYLTKPQLNGMPQAYIDSAAATAKKNSKDGQYGIVNTRSAADPFLTFATDRSAREIIWKAFVNRGDNGGAHDNNALISKILKLRFERAQLLGYATHAHWRLENAMAKTPDNATKLMEAVWPAAVARVKEEVADMQKIADLEGAKIKIAPWDYRFYAEKVRKARYDLDENAIKPYMQLDKLVEGMFWASGQIYGFSFEPITDVPVYHEDVRVWKVNRAGKMIGLFYFDPYARQGKRSGAWMNAYRSQSRMDGKDILTIVSNNSNFIKTADGSPVLISWDDASTLFHEFGHAIHGLLSNVTYPSLAGTSVARDYVEFPSQLNEDWLGTPEVLNKFALHYETGKPIPADLVAKIEKADTFNQGFGTVEYLASALIDMKLHLAGGADIDADKFEREELTKLGMPSEIVMRHRTPQFGHVFSGDGYSAGYYSYLWSDTLTADCAEAFTEKGGFYDKTVADKLVKEVLSRGNTVDPAEAYRNFRGRDAGIAPLMRKRGFPVA
ncbi:M3 family metallopeptidase [Asticcacaulis sp. ZE23SCel15]|uniref:M3 family metallopeptidase n=1 Tax=Asticcacaulis sp. ZE23SCel15 TaxID=3059027 RepID=UPI00265F8AE1|nr:M3 family metallopeptidase [Asticcacaulis sp. ZE23SCel15]WKL57980.1 M3 family metallopeptidase [Asticcacaulis sp. ZE23SCel15]